MVSALSPFSKCDAPSCSVLRVGEGMTPEIRGQVLRRSQTTCTIKINGDGQLILTDSRFGILNRKGEHQPIAVAERRQAIRASTPRSCDRAIGHIHASMFALALMRCKQRSMRVQMHT